jgi:tRNA1Val (adenine37-N6)-methyltransferase
MPDECFGFKQFCIRQDLCAMKVGTDGTLLGAWAGVAGCRRILDVGTGTGLIALMLAQRNPEALIDAIDLDEKACLQARANAGASPFASRLRIIQGAFQVYATRTGLKYDLLVSNPPYFVRSLKNPDFHRGLARHDDSLPLEALLAQGRELLSPGGRLALILPAGREEELRAAACRNGLYGLRQTLLIPRPGAQPKRLLTELSPTPCPACETGTLLLEEARHQYSPAYRALTQDFYLNF